MRMNVEHNGAASTNHHFTILLLHTLCTYLPLLFISIDLPLLVVAQNIGPGTNYTLAVVQTVYGGGSTSIHRGLNLGTLGSASFCGSINTSQPCQFGGQWYDRSSNSLFIADMLTNQIKLYSLLDR